MDISQPRREFARLPRGYMDGSLIPSDRVCFDTRHLFLDDVGLLRSTCRETEQPLAAAWFQTCSRSSQPCSSEAGPTSHPGLTMTDRRPVCICLRSAPEYPEYQQPLTIRIIPYFTLHGTDDLSHITCSHPSTVGKTRPTSPDHGDSPATALQPPLTMSKLPPTDPQTPAVLGPPESVPDLQEDALVGSIK
jgi:hypothetical protein